MLISSNFKVILVAIWSSSPSLLYQKMTLIGMKTMGTMGTMGMRTMGTGTEAIEMRTLTPIITIIHLQQTTRSMMTMKRTRRSMIVGRKIMTKRKWYHSRSRPSGETPRRYRF
jgi:hypothetical protein